MLKYVSFIFLRLLLRVEVGLDVVIFGAGSIGCVFGAHLFSAGHNVTLVARGRNYEALDRNGLRMIHGNSETIHRIPVVSTPREVKSCELGILAVKARNSEQILSKASHLSKTNAVFISLQNSMGKEELLAKYLGVENILGAVSLEGAALVEPGVVEHTSSGMTWVGEYPRGVSRRAEKIANTLSASGLKTVTERNISQVNWLKLVLYCAVASISIMSNRVMPEIFLNPEFAEIYVKLVREGVDVMKACGFEPRDIPLMKVKSLSEGAIAEGVKILRAGGEAMVEKGATNVKISMYQDVLNKKKTEVDETIGYVIKKANAKGLETPLLKLSYLLIRGLERSYLRD